MDRGGPGGAEGGREGWRGAGRDGGGPGGREGGGPGGREEGGGPESSPRNTHQQAGRLGLRAEAGSPLNTNGAPGAGLHRPRVCCWAVIKRAGSCC